MRSFLISSRSLLLTVRTNSSTRSRQIVFCEKMVVHSCRKPCYEKSSVKPLEFGQWFCRKSSTSLIWSAPSGVQYAAVACEAGTGSSCSAMTQHYPSTSAAAAVWASGPSFAVSAVLLICTYSLLPARALSTTLLFVLRLLQRCRGETKGVEKVLDGSTTCSRVVTTV